MPEGVVVVVVVSEIVRDDKKKMRTVKEFIFWCLDWECVRVLWDVAWVYIGFD